MRRGAALGREKKLHLLGGCREISGCTRGVDFKKPYVEVFILRGPDDPFICDCGAPQRFWYKPHRGQIGLNGVGGSGEENAISQLNKCAARICDYAVTRKDVCDSALM